MSEHAERERRTKRYLERLAQQQEADEEIKEYEDSTDECDPSGLYGERSFSRERGEGFVS